MAGVDVCDLSGLPCVGGGWAPLPLLPFGCLTASRLRSCLLHRHPVLSHPLLLLILENGAYKENHLGKFQAAATKPISTEGRLITQLINPTDVTLNACFFVILLHTPCWLQSSWAPLGMPAQAAGGCRLGPWRALHGGAGPRAEAGLRRGRAALAQRCRSAVTLALKTLTWPMRVPKWLFTFLPQVQRRWGAQTPSCRTRSASARGKENLET